MPLYAREAILVDGEHHDIGDAINTDKETADTLLRLGRASKEKPTVPAKLKADKGQGGGEPQA